MYYQLTTCIPYQWKIKLNSEEIQYNAREYLFEKLIPQLKTGHYVYNAILKKKTNIQINQENKWEPTMSSSFNWKIIFGQIMNITIDTKLRSFHCKYLMHIVPNNEKLFKYGMIESSLCDFCCTLSESNIHLF